jgi:hypothetical protein
MSSLQPGPYQSNVLRYVVRQTRRWIDQGKVALRHLKVTADWTAQALLYPVYVVFQGVRLAGAHLQQALALGLPVRRPAEPDTKQMSPPPATISLTADTPIQQALLTVQNFSLPINLPVQLEQDALVLTGVRGVASRLETKSLVLVTSQNQILDILTPPQQQQLRQRIEWEIAHYERYWRIRQATRQAIAHLRPLAEESQKLPPVRALQHLATTQLQSEPIQKIGTRLQQVLKWSLPKLSRLGTTSIALGETIRERLLPGTSVLLPTPDIQIRQILWQAKTLSTQHSALSAFDDATGAAQILALGTSGDVTGSTQNLALSAQHSALNTHFIQAIATQLETKSLVLVTNQNQILDILTTEQQEHLRQRIIWEVANYRRYQQLRQASRRVLLRLRSTAEGNHVLPPVRLFRSLMAWMQSSPIAIATNLFQEASLKPLEREPQTVPLISGISRIRSFLAQKFAPPLLSPASAADLISPLPQNSLLPSLRAAIDGPLAVTLDAPPAPPVPAIPFPTSLASIGVPEAGQGCLTSHLDQTLPEKRFWDFIETQATSIGYVLSPLEKLLRWLDKILLWLEERLVSLWKKVQKRLINFWS